MQITQIMQIFPFSRTGYIRVIRAIRVLNPAVQAHYISAKSARSA